MRILHVLSAEFYAGSVAYAVQLAEAHRAQGHAVWLLSDAPALLPTGARQRTAPISDRRYAARWRSLRRTPSMLFDVYGDKVIAICGNLRAHLVAEVKMDPAKIVEIPNGVASLNEK